MAQKITDAQRAMVEENMPLVTWCVQKVPYWRRDEYDDLYQTGALGLCKAAMRYDPEIGVSFSTFAVCCVLGEVMNYHKREHRKITLFGFKRLEDSAGTEGITIADQIADVETGETTLRSIALRDAIERMGKEERQIIKAHAFGLTQKEIAKRMRITQPSVCRIMRRAKARLRTAIG